MTIYNLISFCGIFVLLGFAWLLSTDRRNMNWRVISFGVGLQLLFGLLVFRWEPGQQFFLALNEAVVHLMAAANRGVSFVFGSLADPAEPTGVIPAFQAFPLIIFFSALVSILYFLGIMPLIVRGFAWVFTRLMRISGAESLCAASNIFVGVESAMTIRPHLKKMTRSELCTILTAGLATVGSNVLGLYVLILKKQFPTIAGHLISASILSAPAALALSKVLLPESGEPETLGRDVHPHYEQEPNIFASVINGANAGLKLIFGIIALLIAVLGLVALLNMILGGIGGQFNAWFGTEVDWRLEGLLGYVFYPFTLMMGVPPKDAMTVARIVGEKLILTEVASYKHLAQAMEAGTLTNPRSVVICTYALCGFTHVASVAIFVGGIAALVPERTNDLAQVAFRALLAATLACLMTACVAGALFTEGMTILGQ